MDETAFTQVTMEAIAERAAASKTTVYRWWPNKAQLAIEAFSRSSRAATASARHRIAPQRSHYANAEFRACALGPGRPYAAILPGGGALRSRGRRGIRSIWSDPRRAEAKAMLRQKQVTGQLRKDADLDLVIDSLYGPLYYRFLVKNELPSQKYAESLAALVIQGLIAS